MKIFGICLAKNDADIIEYLLNENSKWAHKIFVYDNGSTDDTWEIVNELAKTNKVIVPWKKENIDFQPYLRARVYNANKHLASKGDWWCWSMDTDEFYIDDPRDFLSKVPKYYQAVVAQAFEYKLTWEDLKEFEFTNSSPHDAEQLKYYAPLTYGELRFFRHRNRLKWNNFHTRPKHYGVIYKKPIRLKHLQYRSPDQIQKRLDLRRAVMKKGYDKWEHDNFETWQEKVDHRKDLIRETPEFQNDGPKYPYLHFPKNLKGKIKKRYLPFIFHLLKIWP